MHYTLNIALLGPEDENPATLCSLGYTADVRGDDC